MKSLIYNILSFTLLFLHFNYSLLFFQNECSKRNASYYRMEEVLNLSNLNGSGSKFITFMTSIHKDVAHTIVQTTEAQLIDIANPQKLQIYGNK